MQRPISSSRLRPWTTTPAPYQYLYLLLLPFLPFLPLSLAQTTYYSSGTSPIDNHASATSGLLTLLQSPPRTFWGFLASLFLLSLLTYIAQRSAGQISYAFGWVYRRLQGDSAYEEGKKVPGFDRDDSGAKQHESGGLDDDDDDEYATDSDLGRALDYIVAVDDSPAARFHAGALRARSMPTRKVGI